MHLLFLSDAELVAQYKLPFSLSSLRKDRIDGRLGGIPYRRIGGACVYTPDEVLHFIASQPIVRPTRHPALVATDSNKPKRGKPRKFETVEASRRGITVREFRARSNVTGGAL